MTAGVRIVCDNDNYSGSSRKQMLEIKYPSIIFLLPMTLYRLIDLMISY
jgi:hypothetical protein